MKNLKNIKTIIFDYDGTIHDGLVIYGPAFRLAYNYLKELGFIPKESEISDEKIGSFLGYSSVDTWSVFRPDLPLEIKNVCSEMITQGLLAFVKMGKARLYENSLDMLRSLKDKGYSLVFLSNCKRGYMEAHIKSFGLDKYFDGFYCTEDFGFTPKHEIFEYIEKEFNGDFAIIGDRFHDIEVALKHNIFAVGCNYGYGSLNELSDADIVVDKVGEINNIF